MDKEDYRKNKKELRKSNRLRIKEEKKEYREKKKQLKKEYRNRIDSLDEATDTQIGIWKEELRGDFPVKKSINQNKLSQEEIEALRKEKKLPNYTHGEEVFNSVTHIVGGGFGVVGLIVGIVCCAYFRKGDRMAMISMIIFGISMVLLYTISAIYHGLHINKGKQVFQVLDHCTIYFLIAGSYTPCTLIGLSNIYPWNHVFLLGIYLLAILGIVLNATMMRKRTVKIVSMVLYLLIGWAIIFLAPFMVDSFKVGGMALLIAGGVSYSVGSILYGVGKKKRYMHSIFHLFVNLGTLLQYFSILLYLIIQI